MPDVPARKIRDPIILRAIAHRVRVQLYDELLNNGPATAADLAKRIGETQANCSWHLRQLHHYGLIEEVHGVKGRQRPWQVVREAVSLDLSADEDPEQNVAVEAVTDVLLEQDLELFRQWRHTRLRQTSIWRNAATWNLLRTWMTADELTTFTRELDDLVARHIDPARIDPANRPPDTRPVRFIAWAVPVGEETAKNDTPAAD